MNAEKLNKRLARYGADTRGIADRFMGDAELYEQCFLELLQEPSFSALDRAVKAGDYPAAFSAAHALKGLAGNMGFVPIFHTTAEIVVLIRTGKTREIGASLSELQNQYSDLVFAIRRNSHQERTIEG